jgi:peptidoglycan-associated lipoprotein
MQVNLKLLGTIPFLCIALFGCSSSPKQQTYGADAGSSVEKLNQASDSELLEIRTVYFDFDSDVIQSEAYRVLRAHAQYLKSKGMDVRLEGHTDERGSREYNMALGERRGKSVATYLSSQGVSSRNIEVVSYGEENPAKRGSNEKAWAKNRRVEIKY